MNDTFRRDLKSLLRASWAIRYYGKIWDQLEEIEAARNALDVIKTEMELELEDRDEAYQESEDGELERSHVDELDELVAALETSTMDVGEWANT